MEKKPFALILSFTVLPFVSSCEKEEEYSEYAEMESYVRGFYEDEEGAYGHENHLLSDHSVHYTCEYSAYDQTLYEDDYEGDYRTLSLLPISYDVVSNSEEYFYHETNTTSAYEYGEDPYLQTTTDCYDMYGVKGEFVKYYDHTKVGRKINEEDLSSYDESLWGTEYIRYTYEGFGTYEEFASDYPYSAYQESYFYIYLRWSDLYSDLFTYPGYYECIEEVSKEGDVFSFHFTRQYLEDEFFEYVGTVDMSTASIDYTISGTYLTARTLSTGEEVTVTDLTWTRRHVFSLSDDDFEIGFTTEGKDYTEKTITR